MAAEKVTPMVLKVDLQCPCCYKKIKKTLCKFPQIRDQVYDEKKNTVAITVVCCSPEKIRDKLCSRGGKVIKSIEIIELAKPEKKKEAEKPKEADKPKQPEKPKEADKPKEKPKEPMEKPPKEAEKPKSNEKGDNKPKADGAPPAEKPKEASKPDPAPSKPPPAAAQAKGPQPVAVNGVPSVFPYCGPSYDPYAAGPYYHGYGFPPPPQPCYEGYYGNAHGHGHGHGHGYGYGGVAHANRCDNYFSEENPQACTIM